MARMAEKIRELQLEDHRLVLEGRKIGLDFENPQNPNCLDAQQVFNEIVDKGLVIDYFDELGQQIDITKSQISKLQQDQMNVEAHFTNEYESLLREKEERVHQVMKSELRAQDSHAAIKVLTKLLHENPINTVEPEQELDTNLLTYDNFNFNETQIDAKQ